jgi:hypothetical protein
MQTDNGIALSVKRIVDIKTLIVKRVLTITQGYLLLKADKI